MTVHDASRRWWRVQRSALILLCLLLAAGCRRPGGPGQTPSGDEPAWQPGDPIPPSLAPVIIPNPGRGGAQLPGILRNRRPVDEEDAGWEEKLELARGYAAAGYEDEARTVIQAALAQEPPVAWAEQFKNLRTTLRLSRAEAEMLRVDARGTRDYVPFACAVDWVVRVRNVSKHCLVFPAPKRMPDAPSPSALNLTMTRRDMDIYGSQLDRSWNQNVFLQRIGGADIRIPPGGVHEVTVRVPGPDVGEAIAGLRILELGGTLRATVIGEGGVRHPLGMRVRPGRVVVVPRGFEPLARDPLGSMAQAVLAVAPPHLLVAAEFVVPGQTDRAMRILARALGEGDPALRTAALGAIALVRERAVGGELASFVQPLIDGLGQHPDRAESLMQGLTVASGQALAPDARLWMDWARRVEADGKLVVPSQTPAALTGGGKGALR